MKKWTEKFKGLRKNYKIEAGENKFRKGALPIEGLFKD